MRITRTSESECCKHPEGGFSLVELLVVIAIISIMGAISLFILSSQLPMMRLHSSLSGLRGGVNSARMQAIRRDGNVILVINVDTRSIATWSDVDNSATLSIAAGDEKLYETKLSTSIEFGFGNPPQADAPTSGPSGYGVTKPVLVSSGTLYEVNAGKTYNLVISGKGRLTDPDGTLTGAIIYICNPLGNFAAIELLTSGIAIPWEFNSKGDGKWNRR